MTDNDRAAALRALHAGAGFVIPNAWDAGTARILEQVGFPAIATTSAGIAWSCGVPDGGALSRDTMFARVAEIVGAVEVPVSADLDESPWVSFLSGSLSGDHRLGGFQVSVVRVLDLDGRAVVELAVE
ncbi:isocitrate lyase/phosphoenolpyruvate mutase family protein, partial [Microbacterium sp. NEAU-LLC]